MRHALHFVPHKLEREKLALMRRQLCKRFGNRKAIMYPVHMTLVKDVEFDDYHAFMERLQKFCKRWKPIKMRAEKRLGNGPSWGGVVIRKTKRLARFQESLRKTVGASEFDFEPHISLVYAKNLRSLNHKTSPVKKLELDRVSLVLQTRPGTPWRVAKHVPIGE